MLWRYRTPQYLATTALFGEDEPVSKGRQYADRVLDRAGTVLAVGSSALGIALAIKELRG